MPQAVDKNVEDRIRIGEGLRNVPLDHDFAADLRDLVKAMKDKGRQLKGQPQIVAANRAFIHLRVKMPKGETMEMQVGRRVNLVEALHEFIDTITLLDAQEVVAP